MMEEVFEEMDNKDGADADVMGRWFEQFGRVIQWTGSGNPDVLPDIIRDFLIANHPEEMRVAIEA
jgi:hypothetical protein